jgi:hypothetical protein
VLQWRGEDEVSNRFPLAGCRAAARPLKGLLAALLLAIQPLAARAGDDSVLQGQVDTVMAQQVAAAISGGYKVVNLASEWRNADGRLVSGGNSALGWLLGDALRLAHIKVRCTGLCFSSAAHILIASRACIIGSHGRMGLHVPGLIRAASVDVSTFARIRTDLTEEWRRRVVSYGVPSDIVDRVLSARDGFHELSTYEMRRIGCEME